MVFISLFWGNIGLKVTLITGEFMMRNFNVSILIYQLEINYDDNEYG